MTLNVIKIKLFQLDRLPNSELVQWTDCNGGARNFAPSDMKEYATAKEKRVWFIFVAQ